MRRIKVMYRQSWKSTPLGQCWENSTFCLTQNPCSGMRCARVSSKQTKINFGSNRNKPKQDLFCVCFGLFRETKNKMLLLCFSVSNLYRNNRNKQNCFVTNRNKLTQTETTLNFLKNTQIYSLLNCLGGSSICFGSIETSKLSVSVKKQNNRNKLFQNK